MIHIIDGKKFVELFQPLQGQTTTLMPLDEFLQRLDEGFGTRPERSEPKKDEETKEQIRKS